MEIRVSVSTWAGAVAALALAAALAGCHAEADRPRAPAEVAPAVNGPQGEKPMTMQVTSPAFADGERIPAKHTGEGEDVSPPIAWSDAPEGTKEFALICDDPDAPTPEPWVHWVIYKIPGNATGLPEAMPRKARLKPPEKILQGATSWSTPGKPAVGYRGPMPPPGSGTHHYHFVVYALDASPVLEPSMTKKQLLAEIEDHVLATGELVGVYSR
ncbi:MAG: YbhB/YbcL family Raf kinase inhibitor-like protein [Pirellulales bacterium]|nr:YbhB/YbcL family Raf kinase inhibitor-like protein [Pirellulales bacterium]